MMESCNSIPMVGCNDFTIQTADENLVAKFIDDLSTLHLGILQEPLAVSTKSEGICATFPPLTLAIHE